MNYMRYSFSLIGSLLIFLTFLHTITLAQEINGTMDAFYQTTESTTEEGIDKTWNVTQGYFVGFKNAITPQMNYSLNVRTTINETGMQKTTTIFPSTQFNITNDLFGGSLGYHILERDPSNSTRFTSSAWNLNLNSKLKKIPQIRFQYSQDKNYDHLTIHSTNDKAEQFFSGIQYKYDFLSMLFNYSQRNVDNYVQNTIQESENHLGKIDFRKSLFGNKLSVSSEYGWNRDTSTTQFGSNITQLEKRNAIHGLYINDTTPDLGTLDETDILIDNDYATSTSIDIGSTGEDNQNIGADLSFLQTCEMIYLYTTPDPSFSSSRFRWEVYSSNDGDNWNLIDSQASFDYNNVYDRFEIAFPSQQSRFFKIVNTSHDDRAFVGPVYITEIEILGSEERQAGEVDENTTSGWETSTMMTFRPLEKVTFGYTFSYDFNKSKPDYTDNTEKSHGANLLWDIHQYLTSSAQYWTRTDTTSGRKSQNDSYSFQFYSSPLDTLSGSLSFNHSETEETGEELTKSKTDSYLLHLTTTLLEGVDLSSDFH
ncbi:MAG: hypothetical protein SVW57_14005, partial [Thermodesulfobacteriota bacterium]|nr:hypothetical protein [Thermodesulfobacteriota bacterium]